MFMVMFVVAVNKIMIDKRVISHIKLIFANDFIIQ